MAVELLIFKEIKLWQTIITQSKVVRVKDSTDNHEIIEIYHKQAKTKKLSGDTQGAIDDYIKIIKLKPDDIVAYNNIGNIYFSKDYYFHAIRNLKLLLKTGKSVQKELVLNTLLV